MTQIIETQLYTATDVAAGGVIPVGNVIHKHGSSLSASGAAITIRGAGYFKITANVTIQPSLAADLTLTLRENGVQIATATETPAAANDSVNLTLIGVVFNQCGCANDQITITAEEAGAVTAMNVIVERM